MGICDEDDMQFVSFSLSGTVAQQVSMQLLNLYQNNYEEEYIKMKQFKNPNFPFALRARRSLIWAVQFYIVLL